MKKFLLGVLIGVLIVIGAYIAHLNHMFETFVDRTFKSYTHIAHYKIIQKVHDDHQWYCKASIDATDANRLSQLYPFKRGYNSTVLGGKHENDFIKCCPDCWYYFEAEGHGEYGYVLYSLNRNKTRLEVYEFFGD